MAPFTDSEIRALAIKALCDHDQLSPSEAERAFDTWQGDHDYRAWQRGYVEALMFASTLLLDEADAITARQHLR